MRSQPGHAVGRELWRSSWSTPRVIRASRRQRTRRLLAGRLARRSFSGSDRLAAGRGALLRRSGVAALGNSASVGSVLGSDRLAGASARGSGLGNRSFATLGFARGLTHRCRARRGIARRGRARRGIAPGRARPTQLRGELGAQQFLKLRRDLAPWLRRISTTAARQASAALRHGPRLALRPLITVSLGLRLGLARRLRIARPRRGWRRGRRSTKAFPIDGRGIRASDPSASASASATTSASGVATATSLGEQVFRDFRLGEVVLD